MHNFQLTSINKTTHKTTRIKNRLGYKIFAIKKYTFQQTKNLNYLYGSNLLTSIVKARLCNQG